MNPIVLAGITGNLGERIARALVARGAAVRGLVRADVPPETRARLEGLGIVLVTVDYADVASLTEACRGARCVVSALSGLRGVIVDAQTVLLEGAVRAGVPRFVPSDFSTDFTKLPAGSNRNLDLRREFHARLEGAAIGVTSVFNGAFTDMLTGQAPFVLARWKRVLCWGNPDQHMDFTTVDDTAAYTADVALDPSTPRYLHIAGDQPNARDLAAVMTALTGTPYRVFRPGGLGLFAWVIRLTRALMSVTDELYPPWQGMQYMYGMFSGLAFPTRLDNDRYGPRNWITARDVLATKHGGA
jgi:nucleoside-diphosphate-sugar epimerase